jgi:phosphatidylglycerophosphatase A
MTPDTDLSRPTAPPRKKPRVSYLVATWFGLGYLPKAPGTWGSLAGVLLSWIIIRLAPHDALFPAYFHDPNQRLLNYWISWSITGCCWLAVAGLGVWTASRVAEFSAVKDPQFVVIDEVSGQMYALLLGVANTVRYSDGMTDFTKGYWWHGSVRWTVLLAGFLLFRLFDIWKPYPIRYLERLPGGWGIMADDWLAGIYAALLLRLALHFNLL